MESPNSDASYIMAMSPVSESAQSSSAPRPVFSTGAYNRRYEVSASNSEHRPSVVANKSVAKIPGFFERTASRFQSWKEGRNETALEKSGDRAVSTITRGLATDDFKKVYQGLKRLRNAEQKLSDMGGTVGGLNNKTYITDRLERVVSECLPDEKSNDLKNLKKFVKDRDAFVDRHSDSKTLFHRMLTGLARVRLIPFSCVRSRTERIEAQDNKIEDSLESLGSVRLLEKLANAGNADAMYEVGRCYYHGEGVVKDPVVAAKWWGDAAEKGHTAAQYELGLCYAFDEGVDPDLDAAAYWWSKAAAAGNADAMYEVGKCYELGEGVDKDLVAAAQWWRKAAHAGNTDAMCSLGHCYYRGEGVDKDLVAAAQWLSKAAHAGNTGAMHALGHCYYRGEGVDQDLVAAAHWRSKAAHAGNTDAMYSLGHCYYHGEGVDKDLVVAAQWLSKAAHAGNADAMHALGHCYVRGEGVDKDLVAAAHWWSKAEKAGNADARAALELHGLAVDVSKERRQI